MAFPNKLKAEPVGSRKQSCSDDGLWPKRRRVLLTSGEPTGTLPGPIAMLAMHLNAKGMNTYPAQAAKQPLLHPENHRVLAPHASVVGGDGRRKVIFGPHAGELGDGGGDVGRTQGCGGCGGGSWWQPLDGGGVVGHWRV